MSYAVSFYLLKKDTFQRMVWRVGICTFLTVAILYGLHVAGPGVRSRTDLTQTVDFGTWWRDVLGGVASQAGGFGFLGLLALFAHWCLNRPQPMLMKHNGVLALLHWVAILAILGGIFAPHEEVLLDYPHRRLIYPKSIVQASWVFLAGNVLLWLVVIKRTQASN
jgi:hypothetical protein